MMFRALAAFVLVALVMLFNAPANAASFNCAAARNADEKAVCANRSLNDRDVKLSVLYDLVRHLVPMGTRGAIMDDQVAWLKKRRLCGANVGCLAQSYDRRIAAIQKVIDDRVVSQGPF